MKYKIPRTLVKVGRFDNPLEEAVRKYPEPLTNVPIGLGDVVKYMLFKKTEEPFLLMVSQRKDRPITAEYNVILTVTSYSDSKNQQVAGRFEKETGIDLNLDVPEQLKLKRLPALYEIILSVLRGEI